MTSSSGTSATPVCSQVTAARYCAVRSLTDTITAPLSAEDQTAQSMPDVSPTKWHRAHLTWFFEEFVLGPNDPGYQPFNPAFRFLFNSYYEAVGPRHPRPQRGVITRPGVDEVGAYRRYVDDAMVRVLNTDLAPEVLDLVELGLHHEQQHQELALMDIKHVLSHNVIDPVYRPSIAGTSHEGAATPVRWHAYEGGVTPLGHDGHGFGFDNECPRHPTYVAPFELATRAVTAGEVQAFIEDGGYRRSELWLSDGWAAVAANDWSAPLYWRDEGGGEWSMFTLGGRRPVDPAEPVCHVSYYEADAIARWADARLPTEAEWELAAADVAVQGALLNLDVLHPQPADASIPLDHPAQLFGDVWEWTASAYLPYPGFVAASGAVGEYNGKFMVNQHVLRGGACVTPPGHIRATYRNFFPPSARWVFSGLRLARNLEL